jgi:hypothetical protein
VREVVDFTRGISTVGMTASMISAGTRDSGGNGMYGARGGAYADGDGVNAGGRMNSMRTSVAGDGGYAMEEGCEGAARV